MTITSHQIHNVLRTYGKQLRRGLRLSRIRSSETQPAVDKVQISSEARRKQVVQVVASEILLRLANGAQPDEVADRVLSTLNQEYGQPLEVAFDEEAGWFDFYVTDPATGQTRKLEGEDKRNLNARLVNITETVVDATMLKG
ncbi:MAG: DVU0524 family FlgM-associated protein [Thermodesulfobacteriota bacterium]